MPEIKADIFISYAHLDDAQDMGDEGWVTRFHKYLEPRLKMVTGNKHISIWKDHKLTGNDDFAAEISDQLAENGLLVCIYSPAYINSPWCGKEIDLFVKGKNQDFKIENKSRIFKVSRIKLDRSKEPQHMQRLLGYRFYDDKGMPYEEELDQEARKAYHDKLNDLVNDLADLIQTIGEEEKDDKQSQLTVYLADTPDCIHERDKILRELKGINCRVIPDMQLLTSDEEDYQQAIGGLLDKADVYLQLFGEEQGQRFRSGKSMVQVQHELSIERMKASGLPCFYWIKSMPGRVQSMSKFLEDFDNAVDELAADSRLFIFKEKSIEELNLELVRFAEEFIALQQTDSETEDKENEGVENNPRPCLLVVSEIDKKAKSFVPLYQYLVASGMDTRFLFIENTQPEDRILQLQNASAVVIFYGEGSYDWLLETQALVDAAMKDGLNKGFILKADPVTFEKEILASPTYTILDGMGQTDPSGIPGISSLLDTSA